MDDLAIVFLQTECKVKVDQADLDEQKAFLIRRICGILLAYLDSNVVEADVSVNESLLVQNRNCFCKLAHNFYNMRKLKVNNFVQQRVETPLQSLLVHALYDVRVSLLVCEVVDKLDHHFLFVTGL